MWAVLFYSFSHPSIAAEDPLAFSTSLSLPFFLFFSVPWGVSSALSLVQTVTSPSGGALGGGGVGRTISTTVDSLRPHVQYKARVAAENALGKGQPCEHILVS